MTNLTINTGRLPHYNPSKNQPIPAITPQRSNKLTSEVEDRLTTSAPNDLYLGEYTGERFETDILDYNGNPISFPKENISGIVPAGTQYTVMDKLYTVKKDTPKNEFLARCYSQLKTSSEIDPLIIKLHALATMPSAA